MEKVLFSGKTERSFKETGKKEWKMGKESGPVPEGITTKDNGIWTNNKEMESMSINLAVFKALF